MDDILPEVTAEWAAEIYKPPYSLREILNDIVRVSASCHAVRGYDEERMSDDVVQELRKRGFDCQCADTQWEISWKHKSAVAGQCDS